MATTFAPAAWPQQQSAAAWSVTGQLLTQPSSNGQHQQPHPAGALHVRPSNQQDLHPVYPNSSLNPPQQTTTLQLLPQASMGLLYQTGIAYGTAHSNAQLQAQQRPSQPQLHVHTSTGALTIAPLNVSTSQAPAQSQALLVDATALLAGLPPPHGDPAWRATLHGPAAAGARRLSMPQPLSGGSVSASGVRSQLSGWFHDQLQHGVAVHGGNSQSATPAAPTAHAVPTLPATQPQRQGSNTRPVPPRLAPPAPTGPAAVMDPRPEGDTDGQPVEAGTAAGQPVARNIRRRNASHAARRRSTHARSDSDYEPDNDSDSRSNSDSDTGDSDYDRPRPRRHSHDPSRWRGQSASQGEEEGVVGVRRFTRPPAPRVRGGDSDDAAPHVSAQQPQKEASARARSVERVRSQRAGSVDAQEESAAAAPQQRAPSQVKTMRPALPRASGTGDAPVRRRASTGSSVGVGGRAGALASRPPLTPTVALSAPGVRQQVVAWPSLIGPEAATTPQSQRLDEILRRLPDPEGAQPSHSDMMRIQDYVEDRAEAGAWRVHPHGDNMLVYRLRSQHGELRMHDHRSDTGRQDHPLPAKLQQAANQFNAALSSLHDHPVLLAEFLTALERIKSSRFVVLEGFFLTVRQLRQGMNAAQQVTQQLRAAEAYIIVNHAERVQYDPMFGGRSSTERVLLRYAPEITLSVRQQYLGEYEPWAVTATSSSLEALLQTMLHTASGPYQDLLTSITRTAAQQHPDVVGAPKQLTAAALATALRVCLGRGVFKKDNGGVKIAPALYSSDTDKLDRIAPSRDVLQRALGDGATFCPGVSSTALTTEEARRTLDISGYRGPLKLDQIDRMPARALGPMLLMPLGEADGALGPMAEEGGWVTVCPGVNSENLIISGALTCTPKHVEDVLLGSVNILMAGDAKLWEVTVDGPGYSESLFSPRTPPEQANKVLIKQEFGTFSGEGVEVVSILQQPGTTMVTLPGHSWHHTTSAGVSMAIALNWGRPPEVVKRFVDSARRKRVGALWADAARRIDRAHQWGVFARDRELPAEAEGMGRGRRGNKGPVAQVAMVKEVVDKGVDTSDLPGTVGAGAEAGAGAGTAAQPEADHAGPAVVEAVATEGVAALAQQPAGDGAPPSTAADGTQAAAAVAAVDGGTAAPSEAVAAPAGAGTEPVVPAVAAPAGVGTEPVAPAVAAPADVGTEPVAPAVAALAGAGTEPVVPAVAAPPASEPEKQAAQARQQSGAAIARGQAVVRQARQSASGADGALTQADNNPAPAPALGRTASQASGVRPRPGAGTAKPQAPNSRKPPTTGGSRAAQPAAGKQSGAVSGCRSTRSGAAQPAAGQAGHVGGVGAASSGPGPAPAAMGKASSAPRAAGSSKRARSEEPVSEGSAKRRPSGSAVSSGGSSKAAGSNGGGTGSARAGISSRAGGRSGGAKEGDSNKRLPRELLQLYEQSHHTAAGIDSNRPRAVHSTPAGGVPAKRQRSTLGLQASRQL